MKQIIINEYKKENYNSVISIGWKETDGGVTKGDYILITSDLVEELISKLNEYKNQDIKTN